MAADARAISRHVSDRGLRIVPVGVGSAYSAPGEAQSCYLVSAGGRSVAIDLGSGTLNRLQGQIAPEELSALVITHLHPDHCVDLMSLRVYMVWGPGAGRVLTVHGPPGLRERMVAFSGSDGWDSAFTFTDLAAGGGRLDLGEGLVLRHREVPHLDPTHAVRLEHGGRSICFSADCAPNEALVALAGGCDVLVCECSFGAGPVPDGVPHLNARDAGAIAARAGAGRLLLVHCSPELDRDQALAVARASFGGPVGWARQGEVVTA
jgi:ribonuclease BN (tRNA processing enzyme)